MTLAVFLAGLAVAAGAVVLAVLFVLQLWSVFERRPESIKPIVWLPIGGPDGWLDADPPDFDWPERV